MRASLPMYDLPILRSATDGWWLGLAQAIARRGFAPVPLGLDRSDPPGTVWRRRDLVLSQCCGRDLVTHLAGQVAPVAIPSYRAVGCSAGTYRSWLVARRGDPRQQLGAFIGATAAVNYTGSHSGWVALGHALAAAGLPERFFGRAICTGGHRSSLQAVVDGAADLAAIDCVSFALLERAEPALIAGVRVVAESEPAPALPYVTAAARPAEARTRLLGALMDAVRDPSLATARGDLLLESFLPIEGNPYARSIAMAETAARHLQALADALALTSIDAVDRSSIPA